MAEENNSREVIDEIQGAYVNDYYSEVNSIGVSTEESGKKAGQSLADLSIKLDVDCSEALTGLKAIQREAKKATQALRELEEAETQRLTTKYTDGNDVVHYAEWTQQGEAISDAKHVKVADVFAVVSTEQLTEELAKRAENPDSGVKVHKLAPHGEHATLKVNGYHEGYSEIITGAHIYVVTD